MRSSHRSLLLAAALLCVVVAAIHVDDQGGVTALADPDWLGWAYRVLEVGAVLVGVAAAYCAGTGRVDLRARLVWLAVLGVAAGPLAGYVLTRSTGLPGDHDDIGNWTEPLGVVSMVVEGVLVLVALAGLAQSVAARIPARRPSPLAAA